MAAHSRTAPEVPLPNGSTWLVGREGPTLGIHPDRGERTHGGESRTQARVVPTVDQLRGGNGAGEHDSGGVVRRRSWRAAVVGRDRVDRAHGAGAGAGRNYRTASGSQGADQRLISPAKHGVECQNIEKGALIGKSGSSTPTGAGLTRLRAQPGMLGRSWVGWMRPC